MQTSARRFAGLFFMIFYKKFYKKFMQNMTQFCCVFTLFDAILRGFIVFLRLI